MDPEDDDLGKLERFIRAGGDLSSVPEATWAKAGGAPFRDKVTRFRAAGGNPAEIKVPRASPLKQGTPMLGMLTPQHLAQNVRETTANEAMGYPTPFRGTRLPVGTPDPARDFVPEFQKNSDPLNNAAIGLRDVLREDAGKGGIVSHHLANALEGAGRWSQRTGQALAAPRDVWESIPGRVEARPTLLGKADELLGSGVQMAATTAGAFAAPMLTAPGVHEAMGAVMDPIVKAGESAKESTGSTLAQQLIEQGIPAVAGYVGVRAAPNVRPMVRGALERQRAGGITPDVAALAARERAALVPEVRFEHGFGLAADAAKGPLRAEPVAVSVKRTAASSPELSGVVPESVNLAKPAVSVAEGKVGLAPAAGAVVDPVAAKTAPVVPDAVAANLTEKEAARLAEARKPAPTAEMAGRKYTSAPAEAAKAPEPTVTAAVPEAAPAARPAPTGPLKPVIPTEPPAPSTMGRGKSARPKRGPLARSAGSVDPAMFTDFGNAVAKAVEPARAAWEKGTDAVAGAAAKAIDMVPGGRTVRTAVDDALTPVLNREMVGPRVTKGGSTEAMLSEQKRVGDVEFLRGKGERLIREVEKAQKRMTDAEVEAAHAWAAGEADALPTTMRPEARAAYEKLSGFIDETRKSLMDRGLISPEVYAEYPRFLSRIFREKVESGRKTLGTGSGKTIEPNLARADAWNVTAKMPMEDVQKHLAGLTDIQLQPINLPGGKVFLKFAPTEAGKAALDTFSTRVREAYRAGKADLSSAATDAIRKGDDVRTTKALVRATDDTPAPSEVLKIDKPLPAELRAELGEYRDTTTSASVTINAAARKIANYDNLVRMEDIGRRNGFVADKPKGGVVPQGFVEITSDRFGPLKGKIMDKEVHDAMFEAMEPKQQTALQKLASAWKRSHFLYNLPTHGRNLISIPILAEQAGVNMVANSKHWAEAAKNLYQRGKRYEEYVREGVVKQDLASAEAKLRAREAMKPKERAALDATIDTLIDVLGGDVTSPLKSIDGVKHARAFLEEAYAIPDDWLRAAKYEQLRASGMSKMEALSELNASTYNYNQQGPLTKKVTRVPIAGPAANFAYETYRINKNNAMRHPGRIVRSLVFLEAMRQALRSGDDHTPEEEAAYETMLGGAAPWRKLPGMSTIYPLGRDADSGNPEVYDSRFVDPLGNVKEGPRAGIEGAEWGKWGAEVALGGEHPLLNVLGLWMRDGKNSYGRQVYEEDDTVAEKAWKGWRETMAPPLASRQFDRLAASFKGEQYSPNRPKQDPLEAVVSAITGFTWGEFDPGMTQDSLNRGMKAVEAKERRAYNRRAEAGQPERADDAVERLHSAMGEWSRRSDLLDAAARSKPKEPK